MSGIPVGGPIKPDEVFVVQVRIARKRGMPDQMIAGGYLETTVIRPEGFPKLTAAQIRWVLAYSLEMSMQQEAFPQASMVNIDDLTEEQRAQLDLVQEVGSG